MQGPADTFADGVQAEVPVPTHGLRAHAGHSHAQARAPHAGDSCSHGHQDLLGYTVYTSKLRPNV